tara:strand:- start:4824 stop:5099 length:276 start_codon:yes stop_codon:yes gene_type:complete
MAPQVIEYEYPKHYNLLGEKLWIEDECTRRAHDPDHQTLEKEWISRFGGTCPKWHEDAKVIYDGGDYYIYIMPNGHAVTASPSGGEIWKLK